MRPRMRFAALALAPIFLVSACGDDGGSNDATTDTGAPAPDSDDDAAEAVDGADDVNGEIDLDGEWPPEGLPGTGEAGSVTVDGVDYPIDVVRLCDVTDFDAGDYRTREFWIQGSGTPDAEDQYAEPLELDVSTGLKENPDADSQGITWRGPEGLYDGYETSPDLPLDVGSDRITGTMDLRSALGSPPVEITVDIVVPSMGELDCRS